MPEQPSVPSFVNSHAKDHQIKFILPWIIASVSILLNFYLIGTRSILSSTNLTTSITPEVLENNTLNDTNLETQNYNYIQDYELRSRNPVAGEVINWGDQSITFTGYSPDGWRIFENSQCGVTLTIPPIKEPYYHPRAENSAGPTTLEGSGRYWDIPRGSFSTLLPGLIVNQWQNLQSGTSQVATSYTNPEEASGYVASAVFITCILSNIENSDELRQTMLDAIENYNNSDQDPSFTWHPTTITIHDIKLINKWDRTVLTLTLNDDLYYLIINQGKIISISTKGDAIHQFLQETATTIIDRISIL